MGGLIEIASSILSDATRTVEFSAQNTANIATPGYKRRLDFARVMAATTESIGDSTARAATTDFSPGKISETGNPFDLALTGEGFFVVRTASGALRYTRDGQFERAGDGRITDARGAFLQADGADLVLRSGDAEILADGVVLEDGAPVARLDIVTIADRAAMSPTQGGGFAAPAEAAEMLASPSVRQGALEMSNVTTAAEMVSLMAALRRAESGQRLANVYDDLMGRVISTFGTT
jgi:flagellar basal-body rod protein FlgF